MSISVQRLIEDLLREGEAGARKRESAAFDELAGPARNSIVLFGAGGLGRRTAAGLQALGIEPLAFADNNSAVWGSRILGVEALSPAEACARYGHTAVFVVTVWRAGGEDSMGQRIRFLRGIGCERVTSFGPLYWKFPERFLPYYAAGLPHQVYEQADAVVDAAGIWDDDASLQEYLAQLRWRLSFDFDCLADPVSHPAYFPDDLCPLIPGEVFVDCGAYDGDSVASFLKQARAGFGKIIAFEPDPASWAKLARMVSHSPARDKIAICQAATGARNCSLSFSADGSPASAAGEGTLQVDCVALDDALRNQAPTYIKMDIEGAELDALAGAERTIKTATPVLAICSYHLQDHLWKIPRLIRSFNPDYRFFLRPHLQDAFDLVCYAIPSHRLIQQRNARAGRAFRGESQ